MAKQLETSSSINQLPPLAEGEGANQSDLYNVIIETPKGSQNKFKYEPKQGLFKLHKVLPIGAVFPYDFGFIPGTVGGDGDPLDVLILMDQSAFTGCVLEARILGVIEARQTEDGKTIRNDRLVAVAAESNNYGNLRSLKEMDKNLLKELEHFFQSYDEIEGKRFQPIGRFGPGRAKKLIDEGIREARKQSRKQKNKD